MIKTYERPKGVIPKFVFDFCKKEVKSIVVIVNDDTGYVEKVYIETSNKEHRFFNIQKLSCTNFNFDSIFHIETAPLRNVSGGPN